MIQELPANLRFELMHQLFSPIASKVPVFDFVRSAVDSTQADIFLTNVCSLFEYRTFVPDQTIVAPADEADSLIIIVDGKVVVSFDHPIIFSEPVELKHGDAIGDYAILGALL